MLYEILSQKPKQSKAKEDNERTEGGGTEGGQVGRKEGTMWYVAPSMALQPCNPTLGEQRQ